MQRAAIVLCGGKSRRMGVAKATLPFGPETMLARVVRLLGEVVPRIVVVAAQGQTMPRLPGDVIVARDRREARGPLEGLAAGLAALDGRCDAAYATSCDVPLLAPDFVERMFGLLDEHDVAVPHVDGFHHPLASVYRVGVREAIEPLLAQDRLRPVFLYESVDTRIVGPDALRDVDPQLDTLRNLNHPDDYTAALASAGFTAPPELLERLRRASSCLRSTSPKATTSKQIHEKLD